MQTELERNIDRSRDTGKYCPGSNQSDFRISGPRHRILHGHVLKILRRVLFIVGAGVTMTPKFKSVDAVPN